MPFFVMAYRETAPAHLAEIIARIRQRLADSALAQPGRRNSRVFQRLEEPGHLLTVSEWTNEQSFTEFLRSPSFEETNRIAGAPVTVTPLEPLIRMEHMARRASLISSVTLRVAPEHDAELRAILAGEAHRRAKEVTGLVSREAYAAQDEPGRYLVIHSWQTLADLESFRANDALELDKLHAHLATSAVSFVGGIVAQFSAFRPPPARS